MFTCGYVLPDGSQCLHVSRRKALGCEERGKLVDRANQELKAKNEALALAAADRKNMLATNDLLEVEKAKVVKLEANAEAMNIKIKELEEQLVEANARISADAAAVKIITEERDALAQAAIHSAQHREEILQEAAVTTTNA